MSEKKIIVVIMVFYYIKALCINHYLLYMFKYYYLYSDADIIQIQYVLYRGMRASIFKHLLPCGNTLYGHSHMTCKTMSPGHTMSKDNLKL